MKLSPEKLLFASFVLHCFEFLSCFCLLRFFVFFVFAFVLFCFFAALDFFFSLLPFMHVQYLFEKETKRNKKRKRKEEKKKEKKDVRVS